MEHNCVAKYLKELRDEGYNFYEKEELLSTYEKMIDSFEEKGYDGIVAEFQFDMEFWYVLERLKNIIIENKLVTQEYENYISKFEELDSKLISISLPVKANSGLPWWYYGVLKKGSAKYAEDVKQLFGIEIEICN